MSITSRMKGSIERSPIHILAVLQIGKDDIMAYLRYFTIATAALMAVAPSSLGASNPTAAERVVTLPLSAEEREDLRPGDVVVDPALAIAAEFPSPGFGIAVHADGEKLGASMYLENRGTASAHLVTSRSNKSRPARLGRAINSSWNCQFSYYSHSPYQVADVAGVDITFYTNQSGRPGSLTSAQFQNGVIAGLSNWTTVNDDCGFSDGMGLSTSFGGDTATGINAYVDGSNVFRCTAPQNADSISVSKFTGFGSSSYAAYACIKVVNGIAVATDIAYNTAEQWAQSNCSNAWFVEELATHEWGHA